MPANTPWTRELDKINRQLSAGKKLSRSGKADGQDLTDTDRKKLEAEKAKWLDRKEQAKDVKHDDRMKKIQEHTTAVGDDIKAHMTKEVDRVLANPSSSTDMATSEGRALIKKRAQAALQAVQQAEKKAKKQTQKEDNPFKGDTVTYHDELYIVDESFYGLHEAKQGKTKQYRLLLLEDVERVNTSMKAAMSGTGSRLMRRRSTRTRSSSTRPSSISSSPTLSRRASSYRQSEASERSQRVGQERSPAKSAAKARARSASRSTSPWKVAR